MRHHQLRNALIAHDAFLDVAEIQRAVNERTARYQRPTSVPLPVFLTAALEKASRPSDMWEEIVKLRKLARPYRQHRQELTDALSRGDGRAIDRLTKAVMSDMRSWHRLISPAAALGIVGALMATGLGLAGWIVTTLKLLKVGQEMDSEGRNVLVRRILRREEWILTRLGESAARLVNGLGQVQKLWRPNAAQIEMCAKRLTQIQKIDSLWDPSNLK